MFAGTYRYPPPKGKKGEVVCGYSNLNIAYPMGSASYRGN